MRCKKIILTGLILTSFSLVVSAQKRILNNAKKAIYQLEYKEAQKELILYLEKNNNEVNNAFLLLSARCYGDPKSPYFNPDSAYQIVSRTTYYPTTFDSKIDGVVCKSYKACVDTVTHRKEQYATVLMQRAIQSANPDQLKSFMLKYGNHPVQVAEATKFLHETEYAKAEKANKILLYSTFIENYPNALQVPQAFAAIEKINYERVVRINTVKEYEIFLKKFPQTKYKDAVNQHIEDARWQYCLKGNEISRYKEYLSHYPESKNKVAALQKIEEMQWLQVKSIDEPAYYRWFIRTYPSSPHVSEAQGQMFKLDWALASMSRTIEGYNAFIKWYPKSEEAQMALNAIEEIKRQQSIREAEAKMLLEMQFQEAE